MFSIERHLEQPLAIAVGDVLDDDRDAGELGALRGAPAALAGDDLIALARGQRAFDPADDDRLNDAVGLDRSRELVESRIVHVRARLILIRLELIDVDLDRRARRRERIRRVGNQRAESFAESLSSSP